MASVTSLTASKIQELLSEWEGVELSQQEISAIMVQLRATVEENDALTEHFNEHRLPEIENSLAESAISVAELNETKLPDLSQKLDNADLDIQNLLQVQIPAMRSDMEETLLTVQESPRVYFEDEEPTDPDLEGRFLVRGDLWVDTSTEENRRKIWDGVAWSNYDVNIEDFSLTAQKFKTSTHMIY